MTQHFVLSFRLSNRSTSEPVFYKVDGGRFEQTHTVKLNADTNYDVTLTVRPKMNIRKVLIDGGVCPLTPVQKEDTEQRYTCGFTTTGVPSKKSKRDNIHVLVEFTNGAYMKTDLQCKLYEAGEINHTRWGEKLSFLAFDCQLEEGKNYITVLKEKYL